MPLQELGAAVKENFTSDDLLWLDKLVTNLAREGLVAINEETAGYDAGGPSHPTTFVSLPE